MAVDDSMAIIESSGAANLSFDVNSTASIASSKNRASTIPSRCGSAPPSFEETFAAIRNSMLKQQSSVNNVNKDRVDSAAEETLLTDPAYIAYYNTHVNLNPRLPPPLISRETRNLVSYARKLTSFDDHNGALNNKMRLLSTHQEELEDQAQLEDDTASRSGRNETFSDLIQGLNDNTRRSESVQNTVNMTANDRTNSVIAGAGTVLKPSNISDASVGRKHEDMLLFEAYGLPFYPSNSTFQQPQRFQPHFPPQGMPLFPNGYPKFPAIKPVMHNPGPYMNQFGPRLQMLTNFSSQFGFYPPYLGGYASPNMTFDPFSGRQLFNRVLPVQVQPHFPSPIQGQYFQHSFMDNAARDSAQSSQYHHLLAQRESNSPAFMYRDHRNEDLYAGPRGLRGSSNAVEDPKRPSYLEALKFGGSAKLELSDITGKIVEFSTDQHGSRFIQQKLEFSTVQEKESVFTELLPHASHLMTDVYGNYVIQKLFEYGTSDHRKQLANQFTGQMLTLSLQMYGCRVIQKALEVIELDQKAILAWELDGNVIKCVHDQNGNHVIQKCIEHIPAEKIDFIISALHSQVATLSVHPYGCRVIQRVLEHCSDTSATQFVIDDILESAGVLAHDQYGNYVIQHVLQLGKPHERSQVISKLEGKFSEMSQHKYASNVIEKCLMYGNASEQESLIKEIVGRAQEDGNLVIMMKDQYANYVIQRILEICDDEERKILMDCIRENLQCLKKYTYGKHIVARYEQLISGESGNQEPRVG